jgi:outer membrane protein TolC
VDVLRAQVSALRSQVVLASARNDESDAAEALAQTIGAAPETSFRSDESIPEPKLPMTPLAAMVATAKEHRYDVLSARKSLEYARLTDSNVDSDLFPQIQINAAFGNQYSPTTLAFSPFTALPTGTRGSPGFWQLGATATLTLPIIDYGTRSAAHKSARALIQADSAILNGAETGAEVAVRSALREVQTSYENLQTSKLAATLGAESTRIAELQYRSGMISLTDAGATEQSALQAGTDLIAARVKYAVAVIRLKVAVGVDSAMSVIEDGPS